jgi:heme-degrading monooxygenase HmoA
MIRHIVLWGLNEKAKAEGIQEVAAKLDASARNMVGKIPGLLKSEVRLNCSAEAVHDLVLYSEFESEEYLAPYVNHPVHQAHRQLTRNYVTNREAADIPAD